jgi:TPR repeat protein
VVWLTGSFEEAIHWLKLASGQGSGEACEILAQVMERAIRSSAITKYQMTDVIHYHAAARAQGYDLQDVEYSCESTRS